MAFFSSVPSKTNDDFLSLLAPLIAAFKKKTLPAGPDEQSPQSYKIEELKFRLRYRDDPTALEYNASFEKPLISVGFYHGKLQILCNAVANNSRFLLLLDRHEVTELSHRCVVFRTGQMEGKLEF